MIWSLIFFRALPKFMISLLGFLRVVPKPSGLSIFRKFFGNLLAVMISLECVIFLFFLKIGIFLRVFSAFFCVVFWNNYWIRECFLF